MIFLIPSGSDGFSMKSIAISFHLYEGSYTSKEAVWAIPDVLASHLSIIAVAM
jgi:hypothetical protein